MNTSLNNTNTIETTGTWLSLLLVVTMLSLLTGYSNRAEFTYERPQTETSHMISAKDDPTGHSQQWREQQIDERFQQAIAMLHAKQYDFAIKALHRVIELAPTMVEAYVNIGYAMFGKEDYKSAVRFFESAIEMKPYQANAYWGLAVALEKTDDLQGALGAMRTFIHLSPPNDPFLRKARSALWEWESSLKRGPLPEEEQEWIDRRSKEWAERNSPKADSPEPSDNKIKTSPH
ncbi:tetratricopeptide repeat protein [Pseudomonadota bacterium]